MNTQWLAAPAEPRRRSQRGNFAGVAPRHVTSSAFPRRLPIAVVSLPWLRDVLGMRASVLREGLAHVHLIFGELALLVTPDVPLISLVGLDELTLSHTIIPP
jgi:hypothetical protein